MSHTIRTHWRRWRNSVLSAAVLAGVGLCGGENLFAQISGPPVAGPPIAGEGLRYPLLDQNMPVGKAARWNSFRDPSGHPWYQPVRIDLPSDGQVTFLVGGPQRGVVQPAPAQIGLMTGHTYRFKITKMPEYPGVELYPSVEVLDRLHPPVGQEHNFPVPLEITREEIDLALEGRLVTKVIYLEQPDLATPTQQVRPMNVAAYPGNFNLLTEADRAGRPILLIRIGGRLPDAQGYDPGFFGTGAPVVPSVPTRPPAVQPAPPVEPPPQPVPNRTDDSNDATSATEFESSTGVEPAGLWNSGRSGTARVKPSAKKTQAQDGTTDSKGLNGLRIGGWVQSGGAARPK